jgi:hypothetical protein
MQVVPCKFRDQLNKFTGNWMVAKCHARLYYDFYLLKHMTTTEICGPFWIALVRRYDIQLGDVLYFEFVEETNIFEVQVMNNNYGDKDLVGHTGMMLVS